MKSLVLAMLLSTSSAFAWDLCQHQDTAAFTDAVAQTSSTEADHFSADERSMIFDMMKAYSKGWRSYKNEYEALFDFEDRDHYNDRENAPGSNAGEIVYFENEGKTLAIVHFYPGDNEYGAFYEVLRNGKFKSIALISDGEINCK